MMEWLIYTGASNNLSLTHRGLQELPRNVSDDVTTLDVSHNEIEILSPNCLVKLRHLEQLNLSNNKLVLLPGDVANLRHVTTLILKNNQLSEYSIPKELATMVTIQELNLSGNKFQSIPGQIFELYQLRSLQFGKNQLTGVPHDIVRLQMLEFLYLGGNQLTSIPPKMGQLSRLQSLALSDNQITRLPWELKQLTHLRSLSLHNNQLQMLPKEIIELTNLTELSLRGNPLVVRFVREMPHNVPTLLELSGRCIKKCHLHYDPTIIPRRLVRYLDHSRTCDNPQCAGVYFTSRVQCVKFVDFCGKYRVPLLQYLCSGSCSDECRYDNTTRSSSSDEEAVRMKRVLLG